MIFVRIIDSISVWRAGGPVILDHTLWTPLLRCAYISLALHKSLIEHHFLRVEAWEISLSLFINCGTKNNLQRAKGTKRFSPDNFVLIKTLRPYQINLELLRVNHYQLKEKKLKQFYN